MEPDARTMSSYSKLGWFPAEIRNLTFSIFEKYCIELYFCCVVTHEPCHDDVTPEPGLHGAVGKKRERELQNCWLLDMEQYTPFVYINRKFWRNLGSFHQGQRYRENKICAADENPGQDRKMTEQLKCLQAFGCLDLRRKTIGNTATCRHHALLLHYYWHETLVCCYVTHDNLELLISLPLPPECWEYRYVLPHLVYVVPGIGPRASCMLRQTLLPS